MIKTLAAANNRSDGEELGVRIQRLLHRPTRVIPFLQEQLLMVNGEV